MLTIFNWLTIKAHNIGTKTFLHCCSAEKPECQCCVLWQSANCKMSMGLWCIKGQNGLIIVTFWENTWKLLRKWIWTVLDWLLVEFHSWLTWDKNFAVTWTVNSNALKILLMQKTALDRCILPLCKILNFKNLLIGNIKIPFLGCQHSAFKFWHSHHFGIKVQLQCALELCAWYNVQMINAKSLNVKCPCWRER